MSECIEDKSMHSIFYAHGRGEAACSASRKRKLPGLIGKKSVCIEKIKNAFGVYASVNEFKVIYNLETFSRYTFNYLKRKCKHWLKY